jgi:hypothetical protein
MKILVKAVASLILSSSVMQAQALDLSTVVAGAGGYVNDDEPVGTFFYARAGEILEFEAFPEMTQLYCAVTELNSSSSEFLARGGEFFRFETKNDDLHLAVCVKAGGYNGQVIIGIFKQNVRLGSRSRPDEISPEERTRLEEKVRCAIENLYH